MDTYANLCTSLQEGDGIRQDSILLMEDLKRDDRLGCPFLDPDEQHQQSYAGGKQGYDERVSPGEVLPSKFGRQEKGKGHQCKGDGALEVNPLKLLPMSLGFLRSTILLGVGVWQCDSAEDDGQDNHRNLAEEGPKCSTG
jgi:hypothetical protein